MKVSTKIETWPLHVPFRISRRECTHVDTLKVTLERGGFIGRGEASGLNYKGETVATMEQDIAAFFSTPRPNLTREELSRLMPANGTRCAIDCALWDLEVKEKGVSVLDQLKIQIKPLQTAFTLSLDTPQKMAIAAKNASKQPILKLKLGGDAPLACVQAVRSARPEATIIVDANEALTFEELKEIAPRLKEVAVSLIEQPLPRGEDGALVGYKCPVPLCADESCMTRADLPQLIDRYNMINIKLEKAGGLTEALLLAEEAHHAGLDLMVGCMLGTSLAMAPAMLVGTRCQFIDLDGPLLLAKDRKNGIDYISGSMHPASSKLWG